MQLIRRVESANLDQLSKRHQRLLIAVGVVIIIAGAVLSLFMVLLAMTGSSVDLEVFELVDVPYGGNVVLFFVGLIMLVAA